ncbi:AgmX/PglI C-terminal domain-containing protein [Candidatus Peregrinibacteria bacterium]|nr:AgmX/PglI C-terminal domain-containing protein [Candidatus Peregrinibacteria bacterium]
MKNVVLTAISLLVFGCAYHGQIIASSEGAPSPPANIDHEMACPNSSVGNDEERLEAVKRCGDKKVLFEMASFDSSKTVRVEASKRILDIKMIIKLYQSIPDDPDLTEEEKSKFRAYLKKKFELLKECPGLGYSDATKREYAIRQCGNNQLLVMVARYDPDDGLRYIAATSITDVNRLKELWPEIRADDTLSFDVKRDFQRGIVERAKELSQVPKERPPEENTSDRGRLFTEDGELIIRQPAKKEPYSPPSEPETANLNVENSVGAKVRAIAKTCYDGALKRNPQIEGRMKVRLNIGKNGKVSKAFLSENTTESESLAKCVLNRVKSTEFYGFKGGKVEIPVVLINPK